MCLAFPGYYKRVGETGRVIMRPNAAESGKVSVVTGGGLGHLLVFAGYCGPGLVDACAVGNVFAGPSVPDCIDAIKAADGGAGVLWLYGNYGGDRMNFDMAGEMLEIEGIETTTGCFQRTLTDRTSPHNFCEWPAKTGSNALKLRSKSSAWQ